jgi:hypothetical protein
MGVPLPTSQLREAAELPIPTAEELRSLENRFVPNVYRGEQNHVETLQEEEEYLRQVYGELTREFRKDND